MYQENTSLAHNLSGLLRESTSDDWALIEAIDTLASTHGDDVYDEFFYVLIRKRFGAETAVMHWKSIIPLISSVIAPPYVHKGFLPTVLHYMQREAVILSNPRFFEADYFDNIQRSSITDGLTGLYNQTFFKITLTKMIQQARRHEMSPFAIVLLDLDHFKQYNDACGHLAGDHALKQVASIIQQSIRESDIAVRYGGEEFAILLPQATRIYAANVAEPIRQAIEAALFVGQEHLPSRNLTISGGIAEYPLDAVDAEALIQIADDELYKAKSRRNCIYPAGEERRNGFRSPVRSLVEFAEPVDNNFRPGMTYDINEYGMSLGCDVSFMVGSEVTLRFYRPFWNGDVLLSGTVRQVRKSGELNYIGIEFNRNELESDTDLSIFCHTHYRK